MRKFALYFIVFGIFFIGFHNVDTGNIQNENYADYSTISFNERTVTNEKLVLFDNTVDYVQYYVIDFDINGEYSTHIYKYLRNSDEYLEEYTQNYDSIYDYNYDSLTINVKGNSGIGTYDEIMNLYRPTIDLKAFSIVY